MNSLTLGDESVLCAVDVDLACSLVLSTVSFIARRAVRGLAYLSHQCCVSFVVFFGTCNIGAESWDIW